MQLAEKQSTNPYRENAAQRDQLILEYLPYVKRIVYRMATHLPREVELDDLINAGIIGLIQAIERFDPERGNKFITYAVFRIKGAVLSELRSRDFLSRTSRSQIRELDSAYLKLERKLGRKVKDRELAKELGLTMDRVHQLKNLSSISFISFDDLGCRDSDEKENLINYFVSGESEDSLTVTLIEELKRVLGQAIEQLPAKEKTVISLYYTDELTMKEIGTVLHITESRISQIHAQAIIHLRSKLRKAGLIDT